MLLTISLLLLLLLLPLLLSLVRPVGYLSGVLLAVVRCILRLLWRHVVLEGVMPSMRHASLRVLPAQRPCRFFATAEEKGASSEWDSSYRQWLIVNSISAVLGRIRTDFPVA